MYDIDESAAASVNWTQAVKGFEITDEVIGGNGGNDNVPITQLALRTKNLHERVSPLEDYFVGFSGTSVQEAVDALGLAIGNLINSKAAKDASNINAATWLAALGITAKIVRSGTWIISLQPYSGWQDYLVYFSTMYFDVSKHFIIPIVNGYDNGFVEGNMRGVFTTGLLGSFNMWLNNQYSPSRTIIVNYIIVEKL